MIDAPITGGCLCGAVRFRTQEAPIAARACWCRVCQKLSCGNAAMNIVVSADGLEITGALTAYESTADSGNVMRRRFCPTCGAHLFSQSSGTPDRLVIRVGALDDPERGKPSGIIWRASAPSWAWCDPDLPAIDGQPGTPAR